MTETKTTIRSVAALRALADELEALPEDDARILAVNRALSDTGGYERMTDADRILVLLMRPGQ